MRMMNMMEIMMLEAPICENVLQILDMTTPKHRFWRSPNQLLLQDTMESDPPGAPIWARGDPSSWMIFFCSIASGARCAAANVGNEEIPLTVVANWHWGNSRPPTEPRCWSCLAIKKACSKGPETTTLRAPIFAESAVMVWQIGIGPLDIKWSSNDTENGD